MKISWPSSYGKFRKKCHALPDFLWSSIFSDVTVFWSPLHILSAICIFAIFSRQILLPHCHLFSFDRLFHPTQSYRLATCPIRDHNSTPTLWWGAEGISEPSYACGLGVLFLNTGSDGGGGGLRWVLSLAFLGGDWSTTRLFEKYFWNHRDRGKAHFSISNSLLQIIDNFSFSFEF